MNYKHKIIEEPEDQQKYTVYRIISPKGMVYIGKTKNFTKRMTCYMSPRENVNSLMRESLKEFGFENHLSERLATGLNNEAASLIETGLTMLYKSKGISLNKSLGHGSLGLKGSDSPHSIAIIQTDLKGNFLKEFASSTEAAEFLGLDQLRISLVAREQTYYAYGFLFGHKKDFENGLMKFTQRLGKGHMQPVIQLTKEGEFIREWQSGTAADNYFGFSPSTVCEAIRSNWMCGGFLWCKKSDYDKGLIPVYRKPERGIKIKATNNETGESVVFDGIKQAIRDLKIDNKTIKRSLSGKPIKRNVTFSYLEESAKKRAKA